MPEEERKSDAWLMIAELGKQNKRMFTALITVIIMWFATIGGFVWYLNQYDYSYEAYDVSSEDDGFAGYINNGGDMINGASASDKSN